MADENIRKMLGVVLHAELNIPEEYSDHVYQLTGMIFDHFDEETSVNDDDVSKEFRDVLYLLESLDLLKMSIWEKHLADGRIWKDHLWVLREDNIRNRYELVSDGKLNLRPIEDRPRALYKKLSDEIWFKHFDRKEREEPPHPLALNRRIKDNKE